ncbi:hypothetical protein ACCO45_007148 [Purpureocillium lilacinum]|uniref:Uncharacterized protein n=1 Tax=Purpureocillium lilacinum TaxID=33203 RepID=A0ACC4DRU6_PURLI
MVSCAGSACHKEAEHQQRLTTNGTKFGGWTVCPGIERNGYLLAQTLSPVPPPDDAHRLRKIWQSTNSHNVKGDIKHFIKTQSSYRASLDADEINGWVEVYAAYWNAIGEILAGESGKSTWTKVYESWKDLTSMLIRGYNNFGFEAWTIPSLYLVGKYLRLFAIKSDDERSRSSADPTTAASLMQDDFDPESGKQAQLRDCEQHLKRIFTLCLNDRAPIEESRKWGIYFVINLLFKTYFKLNSASLSRTILKTLAVYNDKGDMPPLEAFPKAQRVTFKYYEECCSFWKRTTFRQRNILSRRGIFATKMQRRIWNAS